jgi:phosphatidylserine synthase
MQELSMLVGLLVIIPFPIAGVFRLARFNLLPAKTGGEKETMGLAITSAGGILAAIGFSGLYHGIDLFLFSLPTAALLPLLLALLMASRVGFPSFSSITRRKKTAVVVLGVGMLASIWLTLPSVYLTIMFSYVGFGLARAGYGLTNR